MGHADRTYLRTPLPGAEDGGSGAVVSFPAFSCEGIHLVSEGGASGLVYEGMSKDYYGGGGTAPARLIIKECYPLDVASSMRRVGDSLIMTDDASNNDRATYDRYRERFRDAFKKHTQLYQGSAREQTAVPSRVFEANGTLYIVSDATNGDTLDKARATMDITVWLRVLTRLCEALASMHESGFVYLDMKPENVLAIRCADSSAGQAYTGEIRLFDFDTVTRTADLKDSDTIIAGSGDWSAHEQTHPGYQDKVGPASDLYSVGAILFWLVVDRPPSTDEVIHAYGEWNIPQQAIACPDLRQADSHVMDSICAVLNRTLTVNPASRYDGAIGLRDDLERLMDWYEESKVVTSSPVAEAIDRLHDRIDAVSQGRPAPNPFSLIGRKPAPAFAFTGRESEIENIADALAAQGFAYLSGEAGVGKSTLAEQFAYLNGDRYETYVRLDYRGTLKSTIELLPVQGPDGYREFRAFKEESRVLLPMDSTMLSSSAQAHDGFLPSDGSSQGIPMALSALPQDPDQLYRANMSLLRSRDKDTLLLIDNMDEYLGSTVVEGADEADDAKEAEGAEGSVPGWLDPLLSEIRSLPCDVIITSRCAVDGAIRVGAIADEKKRLRLFSRYFRYAEDDEETVAAIIEELGRNTLGIILAANLMKATDIPARELLGELRRGSIPKATEDLRVTRNEGLVRDSFQGHLATLLRLNRLSTEEVSVLTNITLVPRTGIERTLFRQWCGLGDLNAFNSLCERGLISKDEATGRYYLQPLLASTVATELKPNSEACGGYLEGLAKHLAAAESDSSGDQGLLLGWGKQALQRIDDQSLPIATIGMAVGELECKANLYQEALTDFERALAIRVELLGPDHPDTLESYEASAWVYHGLMDFDRALGYFEKVLAAREKALAPGHLDIAWSHAAIAAVHATSDDFPKARDFVERALGILEVTAEPTEKEVAAVYDTIAYAYSKMRDNRKELEYREKALAIRERILEPDDPAIAGSYNAIGSAYSSIGYLSEALECHEKALDVLGSDRHPVAASSYMGIAQSYLFLLDRRNALKYSEKALTVFEDIYGTEHPSTATPNLLISQVFYEEGDCRLALEFGDRALALTEKAFGSEHPETALTHLIIAAFYLKTGNRQRAFERFDKVLTIYEKTLGSEHSRMERAYSDIASIYLGAGDHRKALEHCGKALAIRDKVLGPEHPGTVKAHTVIASIYLEAGDRQRAFEHCGKALAISEKTLGPEHPDTAQIHEQIALTYYKLDDHRKALEHFDKALAIREKALGLEHPRMASVYVIIAWAYRELDDHRREFEHYGKALAIREKALGPEHPDTAQIHDVIALAYDAVGDYRKALEHYGKALAIREKALGPEHPDTAEAHANVAMIHRHEFGDYRKALEHYGKALAIREKALGPEHPDTAEAHANVAQAYLGADDHRKALEHYGKALATLEKALESGHADVKTDGFRSFSILVAFYSLAREPGGLKEAHEILDKYPRVHEVHRLRGYPKDIRTKNHQEWQIIEEAEMVLGEKEMLRDAEEILRGKDEGASKGESGERKTPQDR